jgi:hypothetical protein
MNRQIVYDPPLALTMYRELAAHLSQLEGVEVELLPQTASQFDYNASQIGGIKLELSPFHRAELLEQILVYYGTFTELEA